MPAAAGRILSSEFIKYLWPSHSGRIDMCVSKVRVHLRAWDSSVNFINDSFIITKLLYFSTLQAGRSKSLIRLLWKVCPLKFIFQFCCLNSKSHNIYSGGIIV